MSFKPTRTFTGSEGDFSKDLKGPEALKADTDAINRMFDPNSTHGNGEQGGISKENLNFSFSDSNFAGTIGATDPNGNPTFVQILLDTLASEVADRYTKSEIDAKVDDINDELADRYTKAEIDVKVNDINDELADRYTKAETNSIVSGINTSIADRYTKSEIDAKVDDINDSLNDRYIRSEIDALISPLVNNITYDRTTGKFTIIKKNGTSTIIDTMLEKIPVSFEFVDIAGSTYLKVTNDDGTYSTTNISSFLKQYNIVDTNTISVASDTSGTTTTYSINVKPASIKKEHLDPALISEIESKSIVDGTGIKTLQYKYGLTKCVKVNAGTSSFVISDEKIESNAIVSAYANYGDIVIENIEVEIGKVTVTIEPVSENIEMIFKIYPKYFGNEAALNGIPLKPTGNYELIADTNQKYNSSLGIIVTTNLVSITGCSEDGKTKSDPDCKAMALGGFVYEVDTDFISSIYISLVSAPADVDAMILISDNPITDDTLLADVTILESFDGNFFDEYTADLSSYTGTIYVALCGGSYMSSHNNAKAVYMDIEFLH